MTAKEKNEFLSLGSTPYTFKGHTFKPMPRIGKQLCSGCGLLALRNDITRWCIKKGCNYADNPHHKAALRRLTK